MSNGYPDDWRQGHKDVLDMLRFVKNDMDSIGVRTIRESLFEMEMDITFGPGTTVSDIAIVHKGLTGAGFYEVTEAHPEDPMTHRYEWKWDGF